MSQIPTTRTYLSSEKIFVVIAHCREDLSWLHEFGPCDRIEGIHVMSKCGQAKVTVPESVANCTQVQRIQNCGVEEFAYFTYIEQNYESLPSFVAFLTAGALPENPHIVHDSLNFLEGTQFKDLARHVRYGWKMGKPTVEGEQVIINMTTPEYWNHAKWMASWRSHFMVSKQQIRFYPISVYSNITQVLCGKKCHFMNCNFEIMYNTFFRCVSYLNPMENCTSSKVYTVPKVDHADFHRDGLFGTNTETALYTELLDCPNRIMLTTSSVINGQLMCVEQPEKSRPANRLDWEKALSQMFAESGRLNLTNVTWAYKVKHVVTLNRKSAWADRSEFDAKSFLMINKSIS